jgi:small subunit ribosomal protein S15
MYLTSAKKKELFKEFAINGEADTGSVEGQVALFTFRIKHLTEHMKENRKDFATERSLVLLVGKRRKLLDNLAKKDITRYREIIKKLGLRK